MAKPVKIDLDLVRGDYGIFKFVVKSREGKKKPKTVDLTEYTEVAMAIQRATGVIYVVVDPLDTDNDLVKGIFYIKIPISTSNDFPQEESLEYDIQLKKSSWRKTIIKGFINVISDTNKT